MLREKVFCDICDNSSGIQAGHACLLVYTGMLIPSVCEESRVFRLVYLLLLTLKKQFFIKNVDIWM